MDMVLWAVPCCIIGARFYYVLFYLDLYRNTDGSLDWGAMFRIWDGGLAIYGAVIAGVLVALVYTKRHKLPFFAMGDVAVMGLLLGQIIGRWANFINREAFGGETTLPWRMKLWVSQYTSIEVHPTFFYESFLLGLTNKAVMEALDGLPPVKVHCSVLAEQAIKAAIADYYTRKGIDPTPFVGKLEDHDCHGECPSCGI